MLGWLHGSTVVQWSTQPSRNEKVLVLNPGLTGVFWTENLHRLSPKTIKPNRLVSVRLASKLRCRHSLAGLVADHPPSFCLDRFKGRTSRLLQCLLLFLRRSKFKKKQKNPSAPTPSRSVRCQSASFRSDADKTGGKQWRRNSTRWRVSRGTFFSFVPSGGA